MAADEALLRLLERAGGEAVPLAAPAQACGEDERGVADALERLAAAGHDVALLPDGAKLALRTCKASEVFGPDCGLGRIGSGIYRLNIAGSTNDIALGLAERGAPEGATVWALSQTAGRGRFGRRWVSPPGAGVWLSVVLRPGRHGGGTALLTLVAAVAVCDAVAGFGARPSIRWPNDVLCAGRKLGGILTESCGEGCAVVGIGLDVSLDPADLDAAVRDDVTSLCDAAGRHVDVSEAALAVLRALQRRCDEYAGGGFAAAKAAWERLSSTLGSHVHVRTGRGEFTGLAVGLDDEGALLVRTAQGFVRHLRSGEVTELRTA